MNKSETKLKTALLLIQAVQIKEAQNKVKEIDINELNIQDKNLVIILNLLIELVNNKVKPNNKKIFKLIKSFEDLDTGKYFKDKFKLINLCLKIMDKQNLNDLDFIKSYFPNYKFRKEHFYNIDLHNIYELIDPENEG